MGGSFLRRELRELLPAWAYFFITFNIVAFSRALMLRQYGIDISTFVRATVGSFLAAKVILIVGVLPFMRPFRPIPIIYNVLWKTGIYWIVAFLVQVLDQAVRLLLRHEPLRNVLNELVQAGFWAVQIWLALLLLAFVLFRELILVLGPERAKEILLGIRPSAAGHAG